MNMNSINPTAAGRAASVRLPQESHPANLTPARTGGQASADRVELSEEARQLLAGQASAGNSRQAYLETVQRRYLSGELSKPEVLERTAEKLLRSGVLDNLDDVIA